MLVFRMHDDRLDNVLRGHLNDVHKNAAEAVIVRDYRRKLDSEVSLFNFTQGQWINDRLLDGRQGTISDARAKIGGKFAISKRPGYLLNSIELKQARKIKGLISGDYSYACPMWLKSKVARKDGYPVALMVYLDLVRIAHIVWIGSSARLPDGWMALDSWTEGLTRFASIDRAYNEAIGGKS